MPESSASSNAAPRAPGAFNPQTSSASSIAASSYAFQRSRNASQDSNDLGNQQSRTNNGQKSHVSPERLSRNPQPQPTLQLNDQYQRLNVSTSNLSSYGSQRPSAGYFNLASHSRGTSPLRLSSKNSTGDFRIHQRKHANSQGFFEPTLPNTSHSDFSNMESPQPQQQGLTASQIAAQAAIQSHQRKRSQTVPEPVMAMGQRKPSRGPVSPPLLSVTEASGERRDGFGQQGSFSATTSQNGQVYRNGLLAGSVNPAATAANVVFARSPQPSPALSSVEIAPVKEDKSAKEKIKGKLFSRPRGPSKDKEKAPGSPSKLNVYGQQRAMASNQSLADPMSSASSLYSLANSSQATIRASDQGTPYMGPEKEHKEKKHHHFLSRQKEKLSGKGDHQLPLSSANSNSRPVDPSAPSSFYNFNLPPSPGPAATSFSKSMSGLDLRHGGRALREKKKEEKRERNESFEMSNLREVESSADWNGPSSLGSTSGAAMYPGMSSSPYPSSIYGSEASDLNRYGLQNMSADDAWPLLKSKILVVFQGEDVRLPIEDFNRLVTTHLQRCISKRQPNLIIDDFRDVITTGFLSIDATLRSTTDDILIPHLVEMWLFVFTSVLPYLQAVFLPLDQAFEGNGPLLSKAAARDFWGALPLPPVSNGSKIPTTVPAHNILSVRRIVLTTYRDIVILPRFDTLNMIFSRLSLDSINYPSQPAYSQSPLNPFTLGSSPSDRPSTALSLDPAFSSYGSQGTTLLNGGGSGSGSGSGSVGVRSRGVSNVSFGSDQREAVYAQSRPSLNLPTVSQLAREQSAAAAMQQQREMNDSGSQNVTDTVARMLQCISVLASVGIIPGDGSEVRAQREERARAEREGTTIGRSRGYSTGMVEDEQAQEKIERLAKALKLNWLGRGRTGRNRRGFVGARGQMPVVSIPESSSLIEGRMRGLPSVS